jgi:hypothetical protein
MLPRLREKLGKQFRRAERWANMIVVYRNSIRQLP